MWWKSRQGVLTSVIAALLTLSIFNLITIWERITVYKKYQKSRTFSYVGNDFPERLPLKKLADLVDYTFLNTSADYPVHGPDAESKWMSIYPDGFGFVRLGEGRRILCTSMFHQLHCVDKLRRALDNPDDPVATIPHLQHCLNYLRQMLICASDVTLEPEGFDPSRDVTEASGVGVTHTCRDSSAIYETINENNANWKEYWETVKDEVPHS